MDGSRGGKVRPLAAVAPVFREPFCRLARLFRWEGRARGTTILTAAVKGVRLGQLETFCNRSPEGVHGPRGKIAARAGFFVSDGVLVRNKVGGERASGIPVEGGLAMAKTRPCQRCKAEIPTERLEALPETRLCVKCSAAVGGDFKRTVSNCRCFAAHSTRELGV